MPKTKLSSLFVVEGRAKVRFHELQTTLLNCLRSKPPGELATREELVAAIWPDGTGTRQRLDQVIFAVNRRRPGLVINDFRRGWCLDGAAEFGEYASPPEGKRRGVEGK